jgi:nicotinamidase-related amidase
VIEGPDGDPLGSTNRALIEELLTFDAVIVAGHAKSQCLAWTIDDLLSGPPSADTARAANAPARRRHLSGVLPGAIDYTSEADAAFGRSAAAGIHVVRSTEPIGEWASGRASPSE